MTMPKAIGAPPGETIDWEAIYWPKVIRDVRWLQMRIAKATRESKWGKVNSLQWLLTHSRAARLLAVLHVTSAKGRYMPGVDGVIWNSPAEKAMAACSLKRRGYRPRPLRRHRIPKKNGRMRALGIPKPSRLIRSMPGTSQCVGNHVMYMNLDRISGNGLTPFRNLHGKPDHFQRSWLYQVLKPYAGKLACTVLRGERGASPLTYPDRRA